MPIPLSQLSFFIYLLYQFVIWLSVFFSIQNCWAQTPRIRLINNVSADNIISHLCIYPISKYTWIHVVATLVDSNGSMVTIILRAFCFCNDRMWCFMVYRLKTKSSIQSIFFIGIKDIAFSYRLFDCKFTVYFLSGILL